MMTTMSLRKFSIPVRGRGVIFCIGGVGAAARSDAQHRERPLFAIAGRDGVIRLDTRTGRGVDCSNTGMGWACYAAADERAALDVKSAGCRPRMKSSRRSLRNANDRHRARSTSRCQRRTR